MCQKEHSNTELKPPNNLNKRAKALSSGQSNPEFKIHILSLEIHILFILWDLMNICKQNKTDIHNSYPVFEMPLTRSSN